MKQQVKLHIVKGNPSNPRIIKNDKFNKLVKSIQEFPEMLKLRPIVVDEDFMVLGGNMRLKASKEAGLKEVWIDIAEGLTEEQKQEFVIKDNVSFGEWDWALLGNEWNSKNLNDWSLDVWQNFDDNTNKVNKGDENSEWVGMPEFTSKEDEFKLIITFASNEVRNEFVEKHKLRLSNSKGSTWSTTYPFVERRDLSSLKYE